ncbi:hypothetical protein TNCT_362221 [Trichonephila clavata]|uniref:Uncharacterized protein n=1 Tax=Trichonephila clavata TaxID=2740835 RepID=A0A8X6L9C4_TRICU|nr:hypothetical protein TNCT_362221 [Trichonephila clavata]
MKLRVYRQEEGLLKQFTGEASTHSYIAAYCPCIYYGIADAKLTIHYIFIHHSCSYVGVYFPYANFSFPYTYLMVHLGVFSAMTPLRCVEVVSFTIVVFFAKQCSEILSMSSK